MKKGIDNQEGAVLLEYVIAQTVIISIFIVLTNPGTLGPLYDIGGPSANEFSLLSANLFGWIQRVLYAISLPIP